MPQITISRRFEWDSAHRIAGHEGACKAVHGHRYVAEIAFTAKERDELGRVIDFGFLKHLIGSWIDSHWDHTGIFDRHDSEVLGLAKLNQDMGRPVYWLKSPPTAENLVLELAEVIPALLKESPIELMAIKLWETPNCWAKWEK